MTKIDESVLSWEMAGMTDGETGLYRYLPNDKWQIPKKIWLEEDKLVWDWGGPFRSIMARREILEGFVQLADADAESVLAFSKEWGVLNLCEAHGIPATHNVPSDFIWQEEISWCLPRGLRKDDEKHYWGGTGTESLEVWHRFSGLAKAILNVAAQIHQGQLGKKEDWAKIYETEFMPNDLKPRDPWHFHNENLNDQKALIAAFISDWLAVSGIRPVLRWGEDNDSPLPSFGFFHANSLFGALGLQLMSAIACTEAKALCSSCGAFYRPTRIPRAGQRRYCDSCRDRGRPQRDAARDSRARKVTPRG